jgi:predicted transcriptional regulator
MEATVSKVTDEDKKLMRYNLPKSLHKLIETGFVKSCSNEKRCGNGYFLYLAKGYFCADCCAQTFSGWTVTQVKESFKYVRKGTYDDFSRMGMDHEDIMDELDER